jgi:hypothetical protein
VTPEEIAISVVAEMVATMRKSDAARPAMRNMREIAAATERKIAQTKSGGRDAAPEIKSSPDGEGGRIVAAASKL